MKKKDLTQGKYIPLYSSETIFPDFITYILNLTPDQIDKPLLIDAQPLPSQYSSKHEYYSRFLNLILEETRASLYSEMLRLCVEEDSTPTEEMDGVVADLDPIYKGIILNEPIKYFKRISIPGDDGACALNAIYAIVGSNFIGAKARAIAVQELRQNIENLLIRNLVKSEVKAALLDNNELSYLMAMGFLLDQDSLMLIQNYKKARKASIDEGDRLKIKYFSHDSLPITINEGEYSYSKLFIDGELDSHCSVTLEEKIKLLQLKEQVTLASIALNQLIENKVIDYINHIVAQSGFWLGVAGNSSGVMGALAQIHGVNFRVFSANGTKETVTNIEELTVICQHISDPDGLINNIYLQAEIGDVPGVQRASWHFDLLQEISLPEQKFVLSGDGIKIAQTTETLIINAVQNEEIAKVKIIKLIFVKFKQAKNEESPSNVTFTIVNRSEIGNIQNNEVFILEAPSGSIKLISLSCYSLDPNKINLRVIVKKEFFHINKKHFNSETLWKATNIGSIVSNLRIYEVCVEQPEPIWLKQVYTGEITNVELELNDPIMGQVKVNEQQRLVIKKFLALQEGIQLIQGPPGTGKTTLVVNLLKHLCAQGRVLVCAPSNKAVQVLAARLVEKYPELPAILVANNDKLSKDNLFLSKIFLDTWHTIKLANISEIKRELGYNCFFICKSPPLQEEITNQTIYLFWEQNEQSGNLRYICKDNVSGEIKVILIPEQALNIYSELKEMLQNVQDLKTELPGKYLLDVYKLTSKNGHAEPANLEKIMQNYFNLIAEINKYGLSFIKKMPFEITQVNQIVLEKILINLNFLEHHLKNKTAIEKQLLNESLIIFATLNVTGRNLFKKIQFINSLIIDEAGQSVEAETLMPFRMKPKKILLIGDTKQLPATVISRRAIELNFSRSLMLRLLEECKQPYEMLTEQYRMMPAISLWPSSQYYEGRLVDSENVKGVPKYTLPVLGSYVFIDVKGQEAFEQCSYQNYQEAIFVERIFKFLNSSFTLDSNNQIGVITFYKSQVALLKTKGINAQTVDGFQGDEKDFIIISFVRANKKGTIGFVKDFRRLNVALTRAKYSLIMLGNAQTLEKIYNKDVAMLIKDAKERDCFFEQKVVVQRLQLSTKSKLLLTPKEAFYGSSSIQQEQLSPRTQKMFSSINNCNLKKFEKIVANVPDINCRNVGKKGDTALMSILRSKTLREGKEVPKIQILIKYGASWTIQNKEGETAEDLLKNHDSRISTRIKSCFLEGTQQSNNMPMATTSFNPSIVINPENELMQFLKHIGLGEQDEAEAMLKINPSLSLIKSDLTDLAGRDFKQITGFQYALWALDWHMWEMIRKYMPVEIIKKQLIGLENGSWIKDYGMQASWHNLIDELQKYINCYKDWTHEQRKNHWCQQVAGKQLLLPAHVMSVYNQSSKLFDPCPDFLDLRRPVSYRKNGGGFKGGVSGSRANRRHKAMAMLLQVRTNQQLQFISEFKLHTELSSSINMKDNRSHLAPLLFSNSHQQLQPTLLTEEKCKVEHVISELNYKGQVNSVAASIDGLYVALGSADCNIYLSDSLTGKINKIIKGHSDAVLSVAFSPDQKLLVSGSEDQRVILWDAVSGEYHKEFIGHTGRVYSVAFSPDGQQIISSSLDKTIKLWDVATGKTLKSFIGHSGDVYQVAFSRDGQQIVSCSLDKSVRFWDLKIGKGKMVFVEHSDKKSFNTIDGRIHSFAFSPNGQEIAISSGYHKLRLGDCRTLEIKSSFQGHSNCITGLAFSPDGKLLASASLDQSISLWDCQTGNCLDFFIADSALYSVVWLETSLGSCLIVSGNEVHCLKINYQGSQVNLVLFWSTEVSRQVAQVVQDSDFLVSSFDDTALLAPTVVFPSDTQNINKLSDIKESHMDYSLSLFLDYIALGRQDEAESILCQNQDLVLMSGDLTDCANRQFKQITALQYAVWALDWNMWEMLKKYLPLETVYKQLSEIEKGVWVKEHGYVASWQKLIDALQEYLDNYNNWTDIECRTYWTQKVGGEQLILPAHVIQEYCRPDKPSNRSQKINIPLPRIDINDRKNWFENNKGEELGRDFGRVRGYTTKKHGNHRSIPVKNVNINEHWTNVIKHDIKLLETLLDIRLQQHTRLMCDPYNLATFYHLPTTKDMSIDQSCSPQINFKSGLELYLEQLNSGVSKKLPSLLNTKSKLSSNPNKGFSGLTQQEQLSPRTQKMFSSIKLRTVEKFEAIVANVPDINCCNIGKNGDTALMTILRSKKLRRKLMDGDEKEILKIQILIKYGASWTIQNKVGETAEDLLKNYDSSIIAKIKSAFLEETRSSLVDLPASLGSQATFKSGLAPSLIPSDDFTPLSLTVMFSSEAQKICNISIMEKTNIDSLTLFLNHIAFGRQDQAEDMLCQNRDLVLMSGNLIDCANRQFKQITALQYAAWALDWHMFEMLKKYIQEEAMCKQIAELERGIWIQEHGCIVSWQKLIDALQRYIDNYSSWTDLECRLHWAQNVGGEQLMLPAHVIQEYCRPDKPSYRSQKINIPLPRIDINDHKNWFENNKGEKLGRDFGRVCGYITKKHGTHRSIPVKDVNINEHWINVIKHDIKLLETLLKVRLQQCTTIICNYTVVAKSAMLPLNIAMSFQLPDDPHMSVQPNHMLGQLQKQEEKIFNIEELNREELLSAIEQQNQSIKTQFQTAYVLYQKIAKETQQLEIREEVVRAQLQTDIESSRIAIFSQFKVGRETLQKTHSTPPTPLHCLIS